MWDVHCRGWIGLAARAQGAEQQALGAASAAHSRCTKVNLEACMPELADDVTCCFPAPAVPCPPQAS